ncbi:hypothetical protein RGQ13_08680 [Thalassotalea psychrophila]|uniref:Uncharacterized protein n=1 Tax=Thalassotalea psychrophila TaxID=3065647 RepID=A0ABY9TYU3_9GAMM|nr:hypothetical protein RGQ13_08680 [Colwelliaceae bacterium SQ149]
MKDLTSKSDEQLENHLKSVAKSLAEPFAYLAEMERRTITKDLINADDVPVIKTNQNKYHYLAQLEQTIKNYLEFSGE